MESPRKIAKSDAVRRGESEHYQIYNYLTKEDSPDVSLAVSVLRGAIPETANLVSDRIYYFLEADAVLRFGDGADMHVASGDVVRIPKNTRYSVEGSFRAVLINAPAFEIANERETQEPDPV